jgi:hypothetical protein
MPKVEDLNITSIPELVVIGGTQKRELIALTDAQTPTWRHPAEAALAEIAEDLGGGIEVMASRDGALDVTMEGSYRIEVRDFGICIVPLARPRGKGDSPGRSWLSHEGAEAMVRLLGAIQASVLNDEAELDPAI